MKRIRNKEYDAAYLRKWRFDNPERAKAIEKRHRDKNKDSINARRRARYAIEPERRLKHKLGNLSWWYGINAAEYSDLLLRQEGKCAICKSLPNTAFRKKNLHVDHDHLTGRIRGLLCGHCNTALGLAKDSPRTLRAMAKYLENHNAQIFGRQVKERIPKQSIGGVGNNEQAGCS